jgi:hypothetical protein
MKKAERLVLKFPPQELVEAIEKIKAEILAKNKARKRVSNTEAVMKMLRAYMQLNKQTM